MRKFLLAGATGVAALAVVAGGSSVALGNWNATNSGAAAGKAIGAQLLSATAGTPASAQLYPGNYGDLTVTVSNSNPYPIEILGFEPGAVSGITASKSGSNVSTCGGLAGSNSSDTTGITYSWTGEKVATSGPVAVLGAATVGQGGIVTPTTRTFVLTGSSGAISMSNNSDDSCNGATFSVPVKVYADSAAGSQPTSGSSTTFNLGTGLVQNS